MTAIFMSPWDEPGVAQDIDNYWASAEETAFRKAVVADLATVLQPGNCLDVGCGSGRIYAELLASGCLKGQSYRGVDTSREMLALARQRYPETQFDFMDAHWMEDKADNVLCIQVLQHMEDWRPALAGLLAASRKLLYVVSWFGEPKQRYTEGFWNNQLSMAEFVAFCHPYGNVTTHRFGGRVYAARVLLTGAQNP